MAISPEERAALHRRYLADHLLFLTPETARWLTEADIQAQAVAEALRDQEERRPEASPKYMRPKLHPDSKG